MSLGGGVEIDKSRYLGTLILVIPITLARLLLSCECKLIVHTCKSCAYKKSGDHIQNFDGCHVSRKILPSEHCVRVQVILYNVVTCYHSSFGSSCPTWRFFKWHKSTSVAKWTVMPSFCAFSITFRLLLTSDSCHAGNFIAFPITCHPRPSHLESSLPGAKEQVCAQDCKDS